MTAFVKPRMLDKINDLDNALESMRSTQKLAQDIRRALTVEVGDIIMRASLDLNEIESYIYNNKEK